MRRIAVIDIGSNSIKCLVAIQGRQGSIATVHENTLPVRIGKGIADKAPKLGSEEIVAGAEAVTQLFSECQRHGPITETIMVGTSALRDAVNASEFAHLVYDQTGTPLKILSGDDEARFIGQGVLEDPLVTGQYEDFTVADLGGGSLELIRLSGTEVQARVSLGLGAVRLVEQFIADPHQMSRDEIRAIDSFVRECLEECKFPLAGPIIGTGGLVTVWRSMEAHAHGVTLPELSPSLQRDTLRSWIESLQAMSWPERLAVPGLPASRADIILPGMLVLDAVLDLAQTDILTHSRFNLRFGLAADWFARNPA